MLKRSISLRAAMMVLAGFTVSPGHASSLQLQELQILGKALSFLQPPLAAHSVAAIVYTSEDPGSLQDATALAGQLSTVRLGGVQVLTRVVSNQSLKGEPFQLIITVDGADGRAVIEAAQANHALCITANVEAVRIGQCTMAIRASDKVEIFLNQEAAARSGIQFATAFRMMVHER